MMHVWLKKFIQISFLFFFLLGGEIGMAVETIINVNLQKYLKSIEENKKLSASIIVLDENGRSMADVEVECIQLTHEFYFGNAPEYLLFAYAPYSYRRGNRFGTKPLPEDQLDQYKKLYVELFNYATLPAFYWSDYEPAPGFLPLVEAIKKIVEWLNENRITSKGHTLVWGNPPSVGVPGWVVAKGSAGEWKEVRNLLYNRVIREMTQFKGLIQMWDVVNEPIVQRWFDNLSQDYVIEAYRLARKVDPNAKLILNEFGVLTNNDTRRRFVNLARKLIEENLIDIIGVEAHIFDARDLKMQLENLEGIYTALDEIAVLGKPIHITEFQIPLLAVIEAFNVDVETAEKLQAEIVKIFYTFFFSHPAVEVIVYWNFYRAWQQGSGFLRDDLTIKPMYYVLKDLIHREWKTSLNIRTDQEGKVSFRGFPGTYEIRAKYDDQEKIFNITVSKGKINDFTVVFNGSGDK
ncbi:MAG: endo-1,4-beta-xylanase [Pseudothermotoga sp.]